VSVSAERVDGCHLHTGGCWRVSCSCGGHVTEHVTDAELATAATTAARVHDEHQQR
jgi:hypothetical protein